MKIKLNLLALLLMFAVGLQAKVITGRVTSQSIGLSDIQVKVLNSKNQTKTNNQGYYRIEVPDGGATLEFSAPGWVTQTVPVLQQAVVNIVLVQELKVRPDALVLDGLQGRVAGAAIKSGPYKKDHSTGEMLYAPEDKEEFWQAQPFNTEEYDAIHDNTFREAIKNPLSTFSIDVDAASYSNLRRFINMGQRPPVDAVRVEEMINYFDYNYSDPKGEDPFSVYTEIAAAPWNPNHKLVHIGLQGKHIPTETLPASNLVFLLDVSGSMDEPNKLPLLKSSLKLLVEQLRNRDRVAIVVYAGAAGLVLPPTSGDNKRTILDALERLEAGGSTAGGQGIKLAYQVAQEYFVKGGNNRVILATDGDFNVGESSNAAMERLIEEKRQTGIFLTVLGFGMGNYKDSKMEILADKGNGNYAYIDNIMEARKVLVQEFGGTLFTIAKDVKLQIEFNPAYVKAYRLIGYENRLLKNEDFNDDKKDAGELGAGHTVTALYEIVPVGADENVASVDPLKYQRQPESDRGSANGELLTLKLRYKKPSEDNSRLLVHVLKNEQNDRPSEDFRWSAAVAAFGMMLRDSEYVRDYRYRDVLALARESKGVDKEGYRMELIKMIETMQTLGSH